MTDRKFFFQFFSFVFVGQCAHESFDELRAWLNVRKEGQSSHLRVCRDRSSGRTSIHLSRMSHSSWRGTLLCLLLLPQQDVVILVESKTRSNDYCVCTKCGRGPKTSWMDILFEMGMLKTWKYDRYQDSKNVARLACSIIATTECRALASWNKGVVGGATKAHLS